MGRNCRKNESGFWALVIGLVPKIVFTSKFYDSYRKRTVEDVDEPSCHGFMDLVILESRILFCYMILVHTGVVVSLARLRECVFSFTRQHTISHVAVDIQHADILTQTVTGYLFHSHADVIATDYIKGKSEDR